MQNWAIILLAVGLIAGLIAFAGITFGALTFLLLAAFFVLLLDGVMLLVGGGWRGRERMT